MTIAVAAKYPWGAIKELVPKNVIVPEAIILISDSRWSYKISTGYNKLSDIGTKVFQVGNDVACVYAGVCNLGESCIDELRYRLSKQQSPKSVTSLEIARQTFNRVFRHECARMRLNPSESPLYILIGTCNQQGKSELYRFNYNNNFVPILINGYDVLGWPETASKFVHLFDNEINRILESEKESRKKYPQIPWEEWFPIPIEDGKLALLMTAILSSIIEDGSDATIGGQVQAVMVTSKGVSYHTASSSKNPACPNPEWSRVTADYDNLKTTTNISGRFGIYHAGV